MPDRFLSPFLTSSFHLNSDLAPLMHMIKVFSRELSPDARQRLAWMDSYRACQNAAQVCRHFSIPLRTFWRWYTRFNPWDLSSLESKSRRPHHSPKKTSRLVENRVLTVKQLHPRWGKEKIALVMRNEDHTITGKTVWKILSRHTRIVRYHTRKRKSPKPRVNWAEIHAPGDLLQLDTKHIILPGRKVYQYTIIDVVTRERFADIYPKSDMATTMVFLTEAFTRLAFRPTMIQTDNGSEFGRSVSAWLRNQKIRHVFSHKRRPAENAYVERSHRTDEEEFYSMETLSANLTALKARFAQYLIMYNTERPHWGLDGKTPAQAVADYSLTKPCQMS